MVNVQIMISTTEKETPLQIQINVLAREDANKRELSIAYSIEKSLVKILKHVAKETKFNVGVQLVGKTAVMKKYFDDFSENV